MIDALRQLASADGTSMEEQARRALIRAVGLEREGAVLRLDDIRHRIGVLEGPSSLDDLKQSRRRGEA